MDCGLSMFIKQTKHLERQIYQSSKDIWMPQFSDARFARSGVFHIHQLKFQMNQEDLHAWVNKKYTAHSTHLTRDGHAESYGVTNK